MTGRKDGHPAQGERFQAGLISQPLPVQVRALPPIEVGLKDRKGAISREAFPSPHLVPMSAPTIVKPGGQGKPIRWLPSGNELVGGPSGGSMPPIFYACMGRQVAHSAQVNPLQ